MPRETCERNIEIGLRFLIYKIFVRSIRPHESILLSSKCFLRLLAQSQRIRHQPSSTTIEFTRFLLFFEILPIGKCFFEISNKNKILFMLYVDDVATCSSHFTLFCIILFYSLRYFVDLQWGNNLIWFCGVFLLCNLLKIYSFLVRNLTEE